MAEEYDLKTDDLIGKMQMLGFTQLCEAVAFLNFFHICLCVNCCIKSLKLFSPKVAA